MLSVEKQLEVIRRGAVEIFSEDELRGKLERAISENRPLRVKLGVDPTAPDIHLGHTVVLNKLRQFQDLGHWAVLIIGDFTAMIGDPSQRKKTRPQLSYEEVRENARTYNEQVVKILDPERLEIVYNGDWFGRMKFSDVIRLAAKVTVAQLIEREDFSQRYRRGEPISLHEFLYPLMQAYDSIQVRADVEIGATDQTFNILLGRELQRDAGMEPQVGITMPMLEGTDGVMKMSKSLGNYIGIAEPPKEIYGKVMSIPDSLMMRYFELVTNVSLEELESIEEGLNTGSLHPRDVKMRLAREIVTRFWGEEAAQEAEEEFVRVFSQRQLPDEMEECELNREELKDGRIWIVGLVVKAGFAPSNSEARRLVRQGAVEIDGERVEDINAEVPVRDGAVLRVGKRRFARIRVK